MLLFFFLSYFWLWSVSTSTFIAQPTLIVTHLLQLNFTVFFNFMRYHLSLLNSRCRHHTPRHSHLSEVLLLQSQICFSLPMSPQIRVFLTSQLHSLLQRTAARLPHCPTCHLCTFSLSSSTSFLYLSSRLYQVFVSHTRVEDSVLIPTQAVLRSLMLHNSFMI